MRGLDRRRRCSPSDKVALGRALLDLCDDLTSRTPLHLRATIERKGGYLYDVGAERPFTLSARCQLHTSQGNGRVVYDVFLASRFDEFREIRRELRSRIDRYRCGNVRLSAVDLNDGYASPRSTIDECLVQVRRADFVILLIGHSYGSLVPGQDKSFTELEFDEANRRNKRVLAFAVAGATSATESQPTADRTGAFLKSAASKVRLGRIDPAHSESQAAEHIFRSLEVALSDIPLSELEDESEEVPVDLMMSLPGELQKEEDIDSLEAQDAAVRGMSLAVDDDDYGTTLDAAKRPAAVAAREQRLEAEAAIKLGDYATAIFHLKKALGHRKQDVKSNYWLALLYVAIGRQDLLADARDLAERAARVAKDGGALIRAAACYEIAARASRRYGDLREGLRLADCAVECADYAFTHLERARQLVASGEYGSACAAVRTAGKRRGVALRQAWSDPALRDIRPQIEEIARQEKRMLLEGLRTLINFEERIQGTAMDGVLRPSGDESLWELTVRARASVRRQRRALSSLVQRTAAELNRVVPNATSADDVQSERLLAQKDLNQGISAHRAASSAAWGVGVAFMLVAVSVVGFGASGAALAWAALASVVAMWRALRVQSVAARQYRAASTRVDQLSRASNQLVRAQTIVSDFRRTVLGSTLRAVFKSPLRARPGDVVRVKPTELDAIAKRIHRQIDMRRLPAWLATEADDSPTLCVILQSSKRGWVLDESAAFSQQ